MDERTLTNIKWEHVTCHLCQSAQAPEPIMLGDYPLVDGQFGYAVHPVICDCGLVYLNPRWSKREYSVFYTHLYDDLYRLETKPDYGIQGVVRNMQVIWERIAAQVSSRSVKNILDVGSGFGHGLRYLGDQIPGSSIFAIESSPACCQRLTSVEVGATLVSTDFDSNWAAKYQSSMDLVVLRHTVEHMLDPVGSLTELRSVLSEEGMIYLATPDNMHPRINLRDYTSWWEYWFRAVHTYYFCLETLVKTLELAGLYPIIWGEKDKEEVWVLAGKKPGPGLVWPEGLRKRQLRLLNSLLPSVGHNLY